MEVKAKNIVKKKTDAQFLRLFFTITILICVVIFSYIIIKTTGVWEKINSIEKLKSVVESGGMFSCLIFVILQILQSTILQLPSIFITIAGTLVFGKGLAFILSFSAVMVGSIIMFWIGRKAGRKFLHWLIGEQESEKWINRMGNAKYLFFLMMVFPMFPDDVLCVVAGLTNMEFGFFLVTNLLARSIGIACTVFLGSGSIIPYHGWGLFVWAILIIVIAALFYLSVKYKNKIDAVLHKVTNRFKKKK